MLNFGFRRFRLGSAFGIPIYLDWSTIFLALMFLQSGSVLFAVCLTVILLASIVTHELAHSLTARFFGCETRDITLTVIGGCASLERMPRKAWQELTTAAAGPAASIVFGIALCVAGNLLPRNNMLGDVLWYGGIINWGLALFNLLPGFPMDGGRIFRSTLRLVFTKAKATYVAMIVGRIAAGILVLGPLLGILLGITHIWVIPIGGSFILRALIAYMIWQEGYREYLSAVDEERFTRWTQADFEARVSPPPYER